MDIKWIIEQVTRGGVYAVAFAVIYLTYEGIRPLSNRIDQTATMLNTRLDKVVSVMDREVIPVINELKKGRLRGPDIKPLTTLVSNLSSRVSSLETEQKQTIRFVTAAL